MFVVRFAQVEHTLIFAVYEFVHRLIALAVDVDLRGLDDALQGRVFEASLLVVTAIARHEGSVADVGLGAEERIVEVLVAAQFLVAFQFIGLLFVGTTPATAHFEVDVLVDGHVAIENV